MKLLALAILATLAPRPADACSISIVEARILRPTAEDARAGRQPLIWVTDKPTKFTRVASTCSKVVCPGTPVEVERVGRYVRPKTPLPEGARLQVTRGELVLDEAAIGKAGTLPAWEGIEWISAKQAPVGKCTPAGPVVELRIKPTKASLADAYLLIYLTKPAAGLGAPVDIRPLENYGSSSLELRNGYAVDAFSALPKTLYVRLVDGDGHAGPVIKLP